MIELKVEGATCQGCVKSIEKAVGQVTGVTKVSYDLDTKIAKVEGTDNLPAVTEAIEMAGFDIVPS